MSASTPSRPARCARRVSSRCSRRSRRTETHRFNGSCGAFRWAGSPNPTTSPRPDCYLEDLPRVRTESLGMFEIAVAPGLLELIEATNGPLTDTARFREVAIDTPDLVAAGTSGACALVVTLQPMRAEHIAALSPSVKVVGRAGVGLDSIDLAAAAEHGVAVINQPDYATAEVATHAV